MKDFVLKPNFFVYRSKKYDSIYEMLVDKKKIFENRAGVFVFASIVGFKNNKRIPVKERATEMRSEHISEKDLLAIICMMFKEFDYDFNKFEDYENVKKMMPVIEEYAEGGMEILCNTAFYGQWDGNSLSENYDEYEIDLVRYIYKEMQNKEILI